jgi:hypothetical protein
MVSPGESFLEEVGGITKRVDSTGSSQQDSGKLQSYKDYRFVFEPIVTK